MEWPTGPLSIMSPHWARDVHIWRCNPSTLSVNFISVGSGIRRLLGLTTNKGTLQELEYELESRGKIAA